MTIMYAAINVQFNSDQKVISQKEIRPESMVVPLNKAKQSVYMYFVSKVNWTSLLIISNLIIKALSHC